MNIDSDIKVFLIPGIMGSSLKYRGPNSSGVLVSETIWGEDVSENFKTLASRAKKLCSPYVTVDSIIRKMQLLPFEVNLYDRLINFCCDKNDGLNLELDKNLHLFPYDWRKDNLETSDLLAKTIDRLDPKGEARYIFITHSMGAIVTKLMLLNNSKFSKNTKLFFKIAPPFRGSAKAFRSLKDRPYFSFLDRIWVMSHVCSPARRAELLEALRNFPSMYQLLPPMSESFITTGGGSLLSAMNEQFWSNTDPSLLAKAQHVHAKLEQYLPCIQELSIYSDCYETDFLYFVSRDDACVRPIQMAEGDGTVTCASAFAWSKLEDRKLIGKGNRKHDSLCANNVVFEYLREAFK
jgi:hypothetical protein